MKKIYYLALILCTFIVSCKKDNNKKPDTSLHQVTFTVAGFVQGTASFTTAGNRSLQLNSLSTNSLTGITNIIYSVYDASGNFIHYIFQNNKASNFGVITDNLPAGNYSVIIVGFDGTLYGSSVFKGGYGTTYSNVGYSFSKNTEVEDTFIKKLAITVGSTSTSQTVMLERVDADLEINIEDAIPTNAQFIGVIIFNNITGYNISTMTPDASQVTLRSPYTVNVASSVGATNFHFDKIVLNTLAPFSIQITCTDVNGNVLSQKTIDNITCEVNKKTILTGNLFGGPAGHSAGGFTATLASAWSPVQDTVTFAKQKNIKLR